MPRHRPRRRPPLPLLAVLALLPALLLSACRRSPAPPAGPENVLLIVVDTLRRDHLGSYGYARPTSPHLDAFAREALVFDRAYTSAPWTRPAVASMFTGLYPSSHGTTALNNMLVPGVETLAETLSAAGWATEGIVSHIILSASFDMDQGFEHWDETEAQGHKHYSTPGVTDLAIAALDRLAAGPRPFLLFVHYFDPHYEYLRHPEVGFAPERGGILRGGEDIDTLRGELDALGEEEASFLRDLYDEEIRVTDDGIGRLLAHLEEAGLDGRTVVVLTADHGEEILERGWLGHTKTLYQELVRVPFMIRGPAGSPGNGTREGRPVSIVSLTPTLLDLLGIDPGERGFEAPSLAAFVRGGQRPPAGNVFSEVDFRGPVEKQARKQAVIGVRFKLIRDDLSGQVELYDLEKDPEERHDLARSAPGPALDSMQRQLYQFSTRERPQLQAPTVDLGADLRKQLRELGYIEGKEPR